MAAHPMPRVASGRRGSRAQPRHSANVSLPTVKLIDGVLKPTVNKAKVAVLESSEPTLYELGIPVCSLEELDSHFPSTFNKKFLSPRVVTPSQQPTWPD